MKIPHLDEKRLPRLLRRFSKTRVLVVGDVMLDQYLWGHVARISPEAPVPVVDFRRESFMPGGAANVARNLAVLGAQTELFGLVGDDAAAKTLRVVLGEHGIRSDGLLAGAGRETSVKTRIIAHQQQVVRVDRETRGPADARLTARLLRSLGRRLDGADAVVVGDYGKGVVTQELLDGLREACRRRGVWLSFDPKPVHTLRLDGLSLLTPNRKEAFELARIEDDTRCDNPLADASLLRVTERLMTELKPALLLITLSEHGMLLCRRGQRPFHIPTVAREVYDVSGAGDTVIASFTVAIAAGAAPVEAAILSNHAAGVVVAKVGTATVSQEELRESFHPDA